MSPVSPGATTALDPPKKRPPPRGRFDPLLNSCFPLIPDQALNLLAEMPRSNAQLRDSRAEGNMKGRSFVSRVFLIPARRRRKAAEPRAESSLCSQRKPSRVPKSGIPKAPGLLPRPTKLVTPPGDKPWLLHGERFYSRGWIVDKKSGRKRIKWSQTP